MTPDTVNIRHMDLLFSANLLKAVKLTKYKTPG